MEGYLKGSWVSNRGGVRVVDVLIRRRRIGNKGRSETERLGISTAGFKIVKKKCI